MIDPYTLATLLAVAASFLKRYGPKRNVKTAYDDLLTQLESAEALSVELMNHLKKYQVKKGELIIVLKRDEVTESVEISESAKKLALAIEQATQETYQTRERLLRLTYEQYVKNAKIWLYFSMATVAVGFIVILTGMILAFTRNDLVISITTTLSGLLINATSLLFFRQNTNIAVLADKKSVDIADLEKNYLDSQLLLSVSLNGLVTDNPN